MDQRIPQVVCRRLSGPMPQRDRVRSAVMLDNRCMADGYVGGSLLEIAHGVTARGHQPVNQRVGVGNGSHRVVDKSRLHGSPLAREGLPFIRRQISQRESRDTLFPGKQFGISALWSDLAYRSVVFGPKLLLQLGVAPVTHDHQRDDYRSDS